MHIRKLLLHSQKPPQGLKPKTARRLFFFFIFSFLLYGLHDRPKDFEASTIYNLPPASQLVAPLSLSCRGLRRYDAHLFQRRRFSNQVQFLFSSLIQLV